MTDMDEIPEQIDMQADAADGNASTGAEAAQIDVIGVPAAVVRDVWSHVEGDIARSLRKGLGELEAEDVYSALLAADMQLWVVVRGKSQLGVVVTEIVIHPRKKVLNIVALAGEDMGAWLEAVNSQLGSWAREIGCADMVAAARYGFSRIAGKHGWKRAFTMMRRELANG